MSRKKKLPFDPEAFEALSSLAPDDQETLNDLGRRARAVAAFNTKQKLVLSKEEHEAQKRFDLQLGPEGGGAEAKN